MIHKLLPWLYENTVVAMCGYGLYFLGCESGYDRSFMLSCTLAVCLLSKVCIDVERILFGKEEE